MAHYHDVVPHFPDIYEFSVKEHRRLGCMNEGAAFIEPLRLQSLDCMPRLPFQTPPGNVSSLDMSSRLAGPGLCMRISRILHRILFLPPLEKIPNSSTDLQSCRSHITLIFIMNRYSSKKCMSFGIENEKVPRITNQFIRRHSHYLKHK